MPFPVSHEVRARLARRAVRSPVPARSAHPVRPEGGCRITPGTLAARLFRRPVHHPGRLSEKSGFTEREVAGLPMPLTRVISRPGVRALA